MFTTFYIGRKYIIINNITVTNITVIYNVQWGGNLPQPEKKPGFTFVGWFTQPGGNGKQVTETTKVTDETLRLYAFYEEDDVPVLYETIDGTVPLTVASVYDGCLYDSFGIVVGTIQVTVSKPKNDTAKVKATLRQENHCQWNA